MNDTPAMVYNIENLGKVVDYIEENFSKNESYLSKIYAIKANYDGLILRTLANRGWGADVSSGQELVIAVESGFAKMTLTGPAWSDVDVDMINSVENRVKDISFDIDNMNQLNFVQYLNENIKIGVRVKCPVAESDKVQGKSDYSRFGVSLENITKENFGNHITRLHFHLGEVNKVSEVENFLDEITKLTDDFPNIEHINIGGGYDNVMIAGKLLDLSNLIDNFYIKNNKNINFEIEPGSMVSAMCGTLYSKVINVDESNKIITIDSSAYNLLGWNRIRITHAPQNERSDFLENFFSYDVYGNTCYENDYWGQVYSMSPIDIGDLLVIEGVGSYVFSTSRNLHGLGKESIKIIYK